MYVQSKKDCLLFGIINFFVLLLGPFKSTRDGELLGTFNTILLSQKLPTNIISEQ